jgi:hypothetical protein
MDSDDAGLADEGEDDNLTVYAAKHQAVLVSLDAQFMRRRRLAVFVSRRPGFRYATHTLSVCDMIALMFWRLAQGSTASR